MKLTVSGSVVLLALCSLASAQTGYFEMGGTGSSCTESKPCADPFPFLPSNAFGEYVLAAGLYTFNSTMFPNGNFTIRRFATLMEVDEEGKVVRTVSLQDTAFVTDIFTRKPRE
ncbi:hypothetical protein QOT17_009774 [Balamuthia mandrillaris]